MLEGGDARAVFARLSDLRLPDGGGYVQGDVARVVARVFVEDGALHLFVRAQWSAYLRRQVRREPGHDGPASAAGPTSRHGSCAARTTSSSWAVASTVSRSRTTSPPSTGSGTSRSSSAPTSGAEAAAATRRSSARTTTPRRRCRSTPPASRATGGCRRSSGFNVLFTNEGELDLCHTEDSLQVEREKSALNRALGVQTDILGPDEILEVCPLGGSERRRRAPGAGRVVPPARILRPARRRRLGVRAGGRSARRGHPPGRDGHRRARWTVTRASASRRRPARSRPDMS